MRNLRSCIRFRSLESASQMQSVPRKAISLWQSTELECGIGVWYAASEMIALINIWYGVHYSHFNNASSTRRDKVPFPSLFFPICHASQLDSCERDISTPYAQLLHRISTFLKRDGKCISVIRVVSSTQRRVTHESKLWVGSCWESQEGGGDFMSSTF